MYNNTAKQTDQQAKSMIENLPPAINVVAEYNIIVIGKIGRLIIK